MTELLSITTNGQGSLVVSSLDYALGLGIQHKNLLETIRTHCPAIEADFGPIAFETRKGDGRPHTVAYLTEDQALFVGTLSRNSQRVVAFKSTLVRAFSQARQLQHPPAPAVTDTALLQLLQQQQQLMSEQRQQLDRLRTDQHQLRADMTLMGSGVRPSRPVARPCYVGKGSARYAQLRYLISQRVDLYCERCGANQGETYQYLYRCVQSGYGLNVFRLPRREGESLIDAIERHGYLNELYAVTKIDLVIPEGL